mgnify:CR=1 FL=1
MVHVPVGAADERAAAGARSGAGGGGALFGADGADGAGCGSCGSCDVVRAVDAAVLSHSWPNTPPHLMGSRPGLAAMAREQASVRRVESAGALLRRTCSARGHVYQS